MNPKHLSQLYIFAVLGAAVMTFFSYNTLSQVDPPYHGVDLIFAYPASWIWSIAYVDFHIRDRGDLWFAALATQFVLWAIPLVFSVNWLIHRLEEYTVRAEQKRLSRLSDYLK